ncbi:type II toxin-antitoxin system Phd/YefM family antitoxin [Dehalococcoidia bacterium]|nr:type II toxin-antitoxin system Phd/YefM family antitoxin [Dehalococcoidia bacterium]
MVIIKRRGAEPVALISANELERLMETAYLLRLSQNAERLVRAKAPRTGLRCFPNHSRKASKNIYVRSKGPTNGTCPKDGGVCKCPTRWIANTPTPPWTRRSSQSLRCAFRWKWAILCRSLSYFSSVGSKNGHDFSIFTHGLLILTWSTLANQLSAVG